MKIETAYMLNYENRNCKYAQLRKQKQKVCSTVKTEIAGILNYENRNWKYT